MDILTDRSKRPLLAGFLGTLLMAGFFAAVLTAVRGPLHALTQFGANWYWMLPLIVAFGVQAGVFVWVHDALAEARRAKAEIAASGGISAASMVACCVHHVADLLPALGIGAVGTLLGAYQAPLGVLALGSNIFGIVLMLATAQKHGVEPQGRALSWLFGVVDLQRIRAAVALLALSAALGATAYVAFARENGSTAPEASAEASQAAAGQGTSLEARSDQQGGLFVEGVPRLAQDGSFAVQLQFDVHEGSLDFDVVKAAQLRDQTGRTYAPVGWQGAGPGGHHREGVLAFPPLGKDASSVTLELNGIWEGRSSALKWDLP